jgi:hypothetical protein
MAEGAGSAPSPLRWPSYLFEGEGQVSLYVLNSSWSHSLPTGATVSSTTEWLLPPIVEDMRLTITGIVVPEPASVLFATLALAAGTLRPVKPRYCWHTNLVGAETTRVTVT